MTQEPDRYFFLQAVDEPSGFALSEVPCGHLPLQHLHEIINPESGDDALKQTYRMSRDQLKEIQTLCHVEFDPGKNEAYLASWSPLDGLPYRLHPNRELILMLSGVKPLTYLTETIPAVEHFVAVPEYLFDPYVAEGILVKREYCTSANIKTSELNAGFTAVRGLRHVLYSRKSESWRIDAFIMVHNTAVKVGWNNALTRLEGTLLGYEEWQNEAFIKTIKK